MSRCQDITMQSAENRRKECHRFWLRLCHCSDSHFERANVSFKENEHDGVDLNSNDFNYCARKNEGKILWFSADCMHFRFRHGVKMYQVVLKK